jgi:hypothetical protein
VNVEQSWRDIYRRTALEQTESGAAQRLAVTPQFIEPPTFGDALRASWAGDVWIGRLVSEEVAGRALYQPMVESAGYFQDDGANWTPANADYRGVEDFAGELMTARSRVEFEVRKLNILDRKQRVQTANSRNGFMHHVVSHILDPTIVVGYGVGRAALGAPARVVGARVAAAESALVGTQQGFMAGRYDDRNAADAVRAAAYAAGFSFVLGTGLASVLYRSKGRMWAGGRMDPGLRRDAAAARQTAAHVVDETPAGSVERVQRIEALYEKPLTRLTDTEQKLQGQLDGLAEKLGVKVDDLSDERLAELYEAGDKGTRLRVQRARKLRNRIGEARTERQLFDTEKALAIASRDSELWQSNTLSAMFVGRAGAVRAMAPRVRVVTESPWERGVEGLPEEVNALIRDSYERLRFGARKLTRSHGMDTSTGKLAGANVEDAHLRRINQLYDQDETLRTAAISALHKSALSGIRYAPVTRNITGVFKWFADKGGELPYVLTGRSKHKVGPFAGAEDELERAMQLLQEKATVKGGKLNVDHVDMPQEVKDLYLWRQGQYQEVGALLRKYSATYVGRVLEDQVGELKTKLLKAEQDMAQMPAGSFGWGRAFDDHKRLTEQIAMMEENLALYRAADNPTYIPVNLAAHKVRGAKEDFIETAVEHFRNNPQVVLRRSRRQLEGPTRELPTQDFEFMIRGRALAMWHATVLRVDYSGRPIARREFIRKLEAVMDELAPTRRALWDAYNKKMNSLQLADIMKDLELAKAVDVPGGPNLRFPSAQNAEEAAWDALNFRLEGLRNSEALGRDGRTGRFLQSEMFATAELDPALFRRFMEDRPTIQFRAYLEREVRRIEAAEKLGDPDAASPMLAANRNLDEIGRLSEQEAALAKLEKREPRWSAEQIPDAVREEIASRLDDYDLLRRQMMGEALFEGDNAFIDSLNSLASLASNVSVATDLGMAGYSVTIDLGQMLAYYGLGPVKLAKLGSTLMKDTELRRLLFNKDVARQFGVAGEVVRGARLRAIQGADLSFGNQGGFVASGNRFADIGRWLGNSYAEAASNIMTASLLNPITDLTQQLAAPLATTRIMQAIGRVATGKGEKIDANILRRLGMDNEMATRAWAQFSRAAPDDQGVRLLREGADMLEPDAAMIMPKFSSWTDQALAQDVMSMISGDIRVATLHPGIAANRIWKGMGGALNAVGRLYYLFTRWAMVSSANVYGKNIEDGTHRHIATAIAYSTAIQMMVNWLKEPDFVEDPMLERMKDAFVMGGGLGYLGIMNERLERMSGHRLGLRPMLGVDTFAHDPDSAQFIMSGLGPVAGKVGGAITHVDQQNYGRVARLFMPYQNWWLWAGAVRDASQYADIGDQ